MKRMTLVWLLWLWGASLAAGAAQDQEITFYVQLLRGTDAEVPPAPEAHRVGPELAHRLHVFKWQNYWEIARRTVVLKPGAKNRLRLTPEREIEIALASPQEMTVSIYTRGQLSRRRQQAADTAFYIAGGDHDTTESWFIVVRRDDPEIAQAGANRNGETLH
jgi:hypothetical protein